MVRDLDELLKPGVRFLLVRHDAWCPGSRGDGNNCICNAAPELVDEATFTRTVVADRQRMNRAQRRKAEREAKKKK